MALMYVMESLKGSRYYIGATNNLEKRIWEHNYGRTGYTKKYRPWILIYQEEFKTLGEAKKRENQLKKWKNKKRIQQLVERNKNMRR